MRAAVLVLLAVLLAVLALSAEAGQDDDAESPDGDDPRVFERLRTIEEGAERDADAPDTAEEPDPGAQPDEADDAGVAAEPDAEGDGSGAARPPAPAQPRSSPPEARSSPRHRVLESPIQRSPLVTPREADEE